MRIPVVHFYGVKPVWGRRLPAAVGALCLGATVLFGAPFTGLLEKVEWGESAETLADTRNDVDSTLETFGTFDTGLPEIENRDFIPTFSNVKQLSTMEALQNYLYIVDKSAFVTEKDLDIQRMLDEEFNVNMHGSAPKILIFHTHSQEAFIDSRPGNPDDSIVGVGAVLANILVKHYNIPVVHDIGVYDIKDGKDDRPNSYFNMEPAVKKLLEKYPSIEVMIDLHRDGVPDDVKLVTDINGKQTAKIMLFNAINQIGTKNGDQADEYFENPYEKENFALSLKMQLTANEMYPGFMRKIYIKPYRYSLHLLPKSMLVEVGANTNTVEEAKNAMAPFAQIIAKVFEGQGS